MSSRSTWSQSCGACRSCWSSVWSRPTSLVPDPSRGSSPPSCSTSRADPSPWPSPACSTGEGSLFWRSSSLRYWWVCTTGLHSCMSELKLSEEKDSLFMYENSLGPLRRCSKTQAINLFSPLYTMVYCKTDVHKSIKCLNMYKSVCDLFKMSLKQQ